MRYLCLNEGENPSAGIVSENGIEMFFEEERMNRIKHASHMFPIRSILRCLQEMSVSLNDIDFIAYPFNLDSYAPSREVELHYKTTNAHCPPDSGTIQWQKKNLNFYQKDVVCERIRFNIQRFFPDAVMPQILFTNHHEAHAWTAMIGSGLKDCIILVADGSGETLCTSVWLYRNSNLSCLWGDEIPNSFGWLYSAVTEYLGFDAHDGEYKVMGVTGLPTDTKIEESIIREIVCSKEGKLYINPKYIHRGKHTYSKRFTDELVDLLGFPPLAKNQTLTESHIAFAKAIQSELEKHLAQICSKFLSANNCHHLAIAGGIALNVKANGYLLRNLNIETVYVNPFPNDTGSALGVPMQHNIIIRENLIKKIDGVAFLGPMISANEIEKVLQHSGYSYRRCFDPAKEIAQYICDGNVVALCYGRSESGQRALGHRSIVGDPRSKKVASRINDVIKRREIWRPLCPSIIDDDVFRFASDIRISPYMMISVNATDEALEKIPAVVHTDGSIRPQVVRRKDVPLYYDIITRFKEISGVGVLINTSFNVDGQPMVESPKDAISTFSSTDIDVLFLDGFLVSKRDCSSKDVFRATEQGCTN